ncbi:MAG: hypothetical protein HC802_22005 [Caldilineaceae bacterium]|nr:hypothetical protein [Caldilineaceae bacterium]
MARQLLSDKRMEWRVFDEDRDDDLAWQALLKSTSGEDAGAPAGQSSRWRLQQRVYELVLVALCIAGAMAFAGWQRMEQRVVTLESELLTLRGEVADFPRPETDVSTSEARNPERCGPSTDRD